MNEVKETVKRAIKELFNQEIEPEITRPEEKFGDFATNVAMQLAPKLSKVPKELADNLAEKISSYGYYQEVKVAGPGFLNITLKDSDIWAMAQGATNLPKPLGGQEILVEFGDPNPFKEMHIGHLYSYIVGDAISRLFEANGATVRRLSYHGDVGLHVAKALWAMQKVDEIKAEDVGLLYAKGAQAYDESPAAKEEIDTLNEDIYRDDEAVKELYEAGKKVSFEGFERVLQELGIQTHKRYLESQSAPVGVELVRANTPKVFKESQGAVVYEGGKVGLHTRVFITSKGLPTYETKDLGLAQLKNKDFPQAIRSIIITAHEQSEYFKVMLAALKEFNEDLASKTTHLSHGFLSLSSGKMSSRTGEVYSANELLTTVKDTAIQKFPDNSQTYLAAVKYGFIKHRLGTDIVYDIEESVSLEGNSGPYLQYAHARAKGILGKVQPSKVDELESQERSLARKIGEFPEVVAKATEELMPHHIAIYIYELAQEFNRFYEHNRVAGDSREGSRACLVKAYANTLKGGLALLNIEAPDKV